MSASSAATGPARAPRVPGFRPAAAAVPSRGLGPVRRCWLLAVASGALLALGVLIAGIAIT